MILGIIKVGIMEATLLRYSSKMGYQDVKTLR